MKHPLNILPLALAAAALTLLPACKAVPKDAPAPEASPAVGEAPAEQGYSWFAKKGQRRGAKAEAAARVPSAAPAGTLQSVIVTGYCSCPLCCGPNATGLTSSGTKAQLGTIAADPAVFPLGTQLNVPGYGEGVVEDSGARVKGYRIDVWFPTHAEAKAWGRREMFVALPNER